MRDGVGCLRFDIREYFPDDRGYFTEVYSCGRLAETGFPELVQFNVSQSCRNTIRGIHFNAKKPQAKLIRVLQGHLIDVVVDLRKGSPLFGQVELYRLSSPEQCLLIPAGYAHGFWARADNTMMMYGCSAHYNAENDRGISLCDSQFEFPWHGIIKDTYTMTEKDLNWPVFDLTKSNFGYIANNRFGCEILPE
jgi:dTDP-4-dehydrorhamnose 3,5-epimerase